MKYAIIYADPPWWYRDKGSAGSRGAEFKYPVLKVADIAALPVQNLAADRCALFLWATFPQLQNGLDVMRAWGFVYKTLAFNWVKTYPNSDQLFVGMGNYTRSNPEVCLLGFRGRPLKRAATGTNISSVIIAPRGQHSAKPPEVRDRIVKLFGDLPRIELFARERARGWHAWGNELRSDITMTATRTARTT